MAILNEDDRKWMLAILANDEGSSDAELKMLFLKGGIDPAIADKYIARREEFLNDIQASDPDNDYTLDDFANDSKPSERKAAKA